MPVKPKKHLGQHFLRDKNIARKIARQASGQFPLLEVGPGTGFLTDFLIKKASKLILIEKDPEAVAYLQNKYSGQPRIQIIEEDFLKLDLSALFKEKKIEIIGNFPYNISSQILFKILENRHLVPHMTGMFQKEVAERIVSPPGNKTYGILSVLTRIYFETDYLFTVPETVFNPPPKVQSAVIHLTRKEQLPDIDYEFLKKLVKTAFNQRRKTLRNSLKKLNLPIEKLPQEILVARPEALAPHQFVEMAQMLKQAYSIWKTSKTFEKKSKKPLN